MTKPSDIMVCPVVALRTLTDAERDVIRNFLFGCIKGLDATHDARWRRMWGRMWKAEAGEVTHLQTIVDRSGQFHKRHMAIEGALFENQERFTQVKPFRLWLKTGAAFGDYTRDKTGRLRFTPSSVEYEKCSDDEMREFHAAAVDFLHTPKAQRRLWPHLSPTQRAEKLDAVLNKPEDIT